ncbi:chromosome segregation protein ParM [Salmonella enterica]|nr:chromosome segregation protein ParM [Salmonella enterica]
MRVSSIQKDLLFVLYAIEQNGRATPVEGRKILEMLNRNRVRDLHSSNFRASCHTLAKHGLISIYRNRSLMIALSLTNEGRGPAMEIYEERIREINEE